MGAETIVPGAMGLAAPQWVIPDGLGTGYGFFDVDRTTLAYLTKHVHAIADPLTRGVGARRSSGKPCSKGESRPPTS